jgi:hypothetical protein
VPVLIKWFYWITLKIGYMFGYNRLLVRMTCKITFSDSALPDTFKHPKFTPD